MLDHDVTQPTGTDTARAMITAKPPITAQPTIIDPPQYSIAWLILAALCLLLIIGSIVAVLRITKAIEKRVSYGKRPSATETLKAEFLRSVNDIAERHGSGAISAREGHHELTAVMRRFVRRTTGHDVTSQDLRTLLNDSRTRDVGELISRLYEPDFAMSSNQALEDSVRDAKEVIRQWS